MQLTVSLLFLTFGSALCGVTITLTEAEPDGDLNLPVGEQIHFSEYKLLGFGASGTIILVSYDLVNYRKSLVLKLVSRMKLSEIKNEYTVLQHLKGKAAAIKLAGIITAYGYGTYFGDDEGVVLVLKHILSPNLNHLGFDYEASTQEILSTGIDLINILEVAHNAGIVHLDIKSLNMLYAKAHLRLAVVLIDWGTAEFIAHQQPRICGTRAFVSPNVATGGVHGPDDDIRSLMYTLGKAGLKGSLPWEITSLFSALALAFGKDINEKKMEFENQLESQKMDPQLIVALVEIRKYLQSASSRVPGKINYEPIRKAFLEAFTVVATRKEVTWSTYLMGLYNQVVQPTQE